MEQSLNPSMISLEKYRVSYPKESISRKLTLVLVNEQKFQMCKNLLEQLARFNFRAFRDKILQARKQLRAFENYRASLYCGLCDASFQNYFNIKNNKIELEYSFCRNMINDNRGLIRFLNVDLLRLMNFTLNLNKCFTNTKANFIVRRQAILRRQLLRIPVIYSCISKKKNSTDDGLQNFNKCWFLCDAFKWSRPSRLLEGDLRLMERVVS